MAANNKNVEPGDVEFLVKSMKDMMNVEAEHEVTGRMMQVGEPDPKANEKGLQDKSVEELAFKFVCQKLGFGEGCRLDDGDQSMLTGEKARALRNQCGDCMDYDPTDPDNLTNMSGWLWALWRGDYEAVMGFIDMVKREEVTQLLEVRETFLSVSALFHVVLGASFLRGSNPSDRSVKQAVRKIIVVKDDHLKIFTKLLELGANIHAKDVAGYTVLHHCLTRKTNLTTMAMARQLLKAGADPNLQNRFGCSPLFDVAMADNVEAIKLLLEFGADPDVKENDGRSCRAMASHMMRVVELFCQADKKKAGFARADAKIKAGGSFTQCKVCGVDNDSKRCTGCYMVWYCSEKCQVGDWSAHKTDCKVIKKQYKEVELVEHSMAGLDNITQEMYVHKIGDIPSKKHFVVKVQASLEHPQGRLFVYNRDRSLCGYVHREGSEQVYDLLLKSIREEGFMGRKGFYYAIYSGKKSKESMSKKQNRNEIPTVMIKINPAKILPVETW